MSVILSKEEISKLIDKMFDEQSICKYCIYYSLGCDGEIKPDGSGNPIYPPCCDSDMKDGEIDIYQYLEDLESEDED